MFKQKFLGLFVALVLITCSLACIVKHEDSTSSSGKSSGTYAYTAGTDGGATITPVSGRMNKGDTPSFTISLLSGRRIDTVLCWVGGSLVRNSDGTYRFTLAPADRDENIFVRTMSSSGSIALTDAEGLVKESKQGEDGQYVFSLFNENTIQSIQLLPEYVKEDGAIATTWRVALLGKDGTDLPYTASISANGSIPRIHVFTSVSPGRYELLLPHGTFKEGVRIVLSGGDGKEREEFTLTQ